MADALTPGLVLMDINLPGINGIEATRRITAAHPDAVVMLLSTYQADDLPSDADSCGRGASTCTRRSSAPPSSATCGSASASRIVAGRYGASRVGRAGSGRGWSVPRPGADSTRDAAADGADPVAHVHEAVALARAGARGRSRRRRRATSNSSASSSSRTVIIACGAVAGVLGRVLQCLEAAEVDRRLHRLRVAADAVGVDTGGQRGAARRPPTAPRGRPRSISSGG